MTLYLRSCLDVLATIRQTLVVTSAPRRAGKATRRMLADRAGSTHLQLQAALVDSVDAVGRQLGGIVLPFGEAGSTNIGVITARAGSYQLPDDLSRVKLVDYHQEPPRAVGHAVHAEETPQGLRMRFQLGSSDLATAVLVAADEHVVDSFSVEMTDVQVDTLGYLQSGLVTAVAMVPVPAFASARVDYIAASQHPTEGSNMLTAEQRARLRELLARTTDLTDAERAELDQLTQLAVAEASADQAPATPDAAGATSTPAPAAAAPQLAAGLVLPQGLAVAPAGVQLQAGQSRHTLTDLYAAVSRVATGQSRAHMEAALADITNTANPGIAPTQYDGQLWSGLQYRRRFVPLMASGNLTAYKGTGWRWATKPEVDDYAGDKADVPSNAADTEDAPWTAARLAGAHDFDRKFIDFGDTEFVQAYYEAMRESYAKKSDAKGGAFIVASATAGAAIVGNLLQAAATVATRVEDAVNQEIDYVMVNSADRLALINMVEDELPAYLAMFGISPEKFVGTTLVPAGTVLAGVKSATEFKELSETPIRVETVNIAKGGVDGGVFGYYATLLHDADGIQKATFAPAP